MLAQNRTAVIKISCLATLGNYLCTYTLYCLCVITSGRSREAAAEASEASEATYYE